MVCLYCCRGSLDQRDNQPVAESAAVGVMVYYGCLLLALGAVYVLHNETVGKSHAKLSGRPKICF